MERCPKCNWFHTGDCMGIHPAKTPMEGGFSLEKFMPNTDPETAQALGEMLDAMEAEKRLDGWIPCADRLPEKDQTVLIYLDEMATIIRMLAHQVRKTNQDNETARKAMDYLTRHNLQGSILRGE